MRACVRALEDCDLAVMMWWEVGPEETSNKMVRSETSGFGELVIGDGDFE